MHAAATSGLALVALAAVTAGAFQFLGAPKPPPATPAAPPVPVVAAAVRQHDVPIILDGLGTVQALNSATIRSQVTGLLQSVNFVEGQTVQRGVLLAQVDPRPNQARLDQANAQLARDQAQLSNTEVNLGRNLPLLKRGFATSQQVADQASQVAQLRSALKSDQAAVEDAATQLSYTRLTAPFDGVTGVRTLDVGNIIHTTDTTGLVVVTQVQPIAILFTLPAASIPRVQDALAKGPVTTVAYDQAGNRALDTGRLLLINNQADASTGTVQLKALFPNPHRLLWPGTFVNVELTAAVVEHAFTIPNDAVQQGTRGEFVFVIGADHRVTQRQVQISQRLRRVALVSSGLKAGESVVVQGQYRLVDGTAVVASAPSQVVNSSTATAGLLP
jgi:multidrug efflux system membrane fusion protein